MDYFDRFEWAVPWAFHDAVDQCRFERGDTLYDTREAYGPDWSIASEVIRHHIRVRHPEKLSGVAAVEGGSVFRSNWGSEVRLHVFEKMRQVESEVVSTQGRLYTALWHGDLSVLNPDIAEPIVPDGWREVLSRIESVRRVAESPRFGGSVFTMPFDPASTLSREKHKSVVSQLATHLADGPVHLSPDEAGLSDPETVAPTVYVAFFPVRDLRVSELEDLVKAALYVPTKGAKNPNFRLSAHGAVF